MSATELAAYVSPDGQERDDLRRADPILPSTFEPWHVPPDAVVRHRLLDTLTKGVETTPLTVLSAPAGAGKTVLAASWLTAGCVSWPITWVTVDDACDRPDRFWRCVCAALTRAGVAVPRAGLHGDEDALATRFLVRLAADLLQRDRPTVLVLDTVARSLPGTITSGLDFLLQHAHPRFRLVLCGRADPQLPLHRYRLAESVTEVRQDALAFTVSESRQLFASCNVPISDLTAGALTELTEGWAAGLRLAAMSMQQGADAATLLDSLSAPAFGVAEYLFAEVLDALSLSLRRLLIETSVCEQLWPELVDELTGRRDARRALASLVRANAFVQRSSTQPGCFRVHPLFRELLRAQLNCESPHKVSGLHRTCAEWFAASGDSVAAVAHAVAGQHWQHATELLVEPAAIGSLLAQDDSPYAAPVRSMPPDVPGVEAALLRAAWSFRCGRPVRDEDAAVIAGLAGQRCGATAAQVSAATVQCALTAATAAGSAESAHALQLTEIAQRSLVRRPEGTRDLAAIVAISRAAALLKARGGAAAAGAWKAAVHESSSSGLRSACLAGLALAEALYGRLRRARELGLAAEELGDSCSVPRERRPAAAPLALAWAACETLQPSESRRWMALAEQSAAGYVDALVQPLITVLRARMLQVRQDLAQAGDEVDPAADWPTWLRELDLVTRATGQLACGHADQAVMISNGLPEPRSDLLRGRASGARSTFELRDVTDDDDAALGVRVDVWINRACLHLDQGQTAQAVAAAKHALRLAEPEQLRRPFNQSSSQFRRLLRTNPALTAGATWLYQPPQTVVELHRQAPRPARPRPAAATQPVDAAALTERETEVLRLLAELMSTEEIGAALFVSVNTVRTHIRSILRKLAVSRRNEAVRRARELALV